MELLTNREAIMGNDLQPSKDVIPRALVDSPGFLLNRAARIIREMNNQVLKPTGLSVRDLGLLRVIATEGPLSQQELSSKHRTDRTTIVDVIDGLEKRELVARLPNPKDRRSYLLTVTPRGTKLLAAANKLTDKEKKRFLAALTEDEWENMRALLARIINFHEAAES
jgi:MarR family transcriptional regulator, lower aerobic nicotinate degradation pathway regulator